MLASEASNKAADKIHKSFPSLSIFPNTKFDFSPHFSNKGCSLPFRETRRSYDYFALFSVLLHTGINTTILCLDFPSLWVQACLFMAVLFLFSKHILGLQWQRSIVHLKFERLAKDVVCTITRASHSSEGIRLERCDVIQKNGDFLGGGSIENDFQKDGATDTDTCFDESVEERFCLRDEIVVTRFLMVIPLRAEDAKPPIKHLKSGGFFRGFWKLNTVKNLVFLPGMLDSKQARALRRYFLTIP